MHDPCTLAHSIKYPWYRYEPWPSKYRKKLGGPNNPKNRIWKEMPEDLKKSRDSFWEEGYRESFIDIWHNDPETDGSDDSCGYSFVKLTGEQRESLWNAAWHEARKPHFLRCASKHWTGSLIDAELLRRGMILLVARVLRLKMTFDEVARRASEDTHIREIWEAGNEFCFLPGYHTNSEKDDPEQRQRHFYGILCGVARSILTNRRPWWRHPKWHFWHWSFQCHPLQNLKRRVFSRCCKCGGRFSWGYCPTSNNWNGTGPLWFRSEKDVYHSDCNNPTFNNATKQQIAKAL